MYNLDLLHIQEPELKCIGCDGGDWFSGRCDTCSNREIKELFGTYSKMRKV
jgi:hypothetical protein